MFIFTLFFLLGDCLLQNFSYLPPTWLIVVCFLIAISVLLKWRRCLWLAAGLLGMAYAAWYAHHVLSWSISSAQENQAMLIQGYIADLPMQTKWGTNFIFSLGSKSLIKLSWKHPPKILKVGDEWQLFVKLKKIHSTQNPGGFDYEAYALQHGLRANGRVLESSNNQLLSHAWYRHPVHHFRQKIHDQLQQHLPHFSSTPWLMALIIGDRQHVSDQDWEVLRRTGTNHLMAIAGLHIGMLAGLIHGCVSVIWRLMPSLMLMLPIQLAGAVFALLGAFIYSVCAGLSIPTQRACLMLFVLVIALLSKKKINPWHIWSWALLSVLIVNPLVVLGESFWLSFSTIALIIYSMRGRLSVANWWWKWGRAQWVIGVGLIPLSIYLFQEFSIISFIANMIAIPWLGFFILPFCLLGTLCLGVVPALGDVLLLFAAKSMAGLWVVLAQLSQWHFASWHHAFSSFSILLSMLIGFALLLMPAGAPGRWIACFFLLAGMVDASEKPKQGDYWVTLLDVGQGLSVVVQTQQHTLVFDTGPKFNAQSDMGERVVVPFLRRQGIKRIDALVISHGDNDHAGGMQSVKNAFPVLQIKSSEPIRLGLSMSQLCLDGLPWEWDHVRFQFLHPTLAMIEEGNDGSCVLRIDNGEKATLLTGDIERKGEQDLVMRHFNELNATILVAPHHGSKSSVLKSFIAAVHPDYTLYAIGYQNRYHFPHPMVVEAYQDVGSKQLNTADGGAMQFKVRKGQPVWPALYRIQKHAYWFDGLKAVG